MKKGHLIECLDFQAFSKPVDWQTGAGDQTTGDWLKPNGHHFMIVAYKGIGTAGDDPTFTVQQASDNAGTGAKALNFTVIWIKVSTTSVQAAAGNWTKVTQSAGNTYLNTDMAESAGWIVIPFDTSDMDVDGGFKYVNCTVADVGGNAQLGNVFLVSGELRFGGAPTFRIDMTA